MEQLHRRPRRHKPVVLAVAAQEHEHGAEPLATRGERSGGVHAERGPVSLCHLGQAGLGALEEASQRWTAGGEHRSELRLRRVHRRVPAWIAIIPPAVRSQRTSSRPAAAIRAASSSGPGKRRTLLGR